MPPMRSMELPKQDHYEIARNAALERLESCFDVERLSALGAEVGPDGSIELSSLCWRFSIKLDPFSMVLLPGREEVDIVWQILVLNYLGAGLPKAPVRFVSFAEFAGARGYLQAFEGRVLKRLSGRQGNNKGEFARAAERCGGARGSENPLSYVFKFFPKFEFEVVRYEGDEDFPPSCNVLFQDNALEVLTAESMIVAADQLVSSLCGKTPAGKH